MSALRFRKVDNSAGFDICLEESCNRSGRFAILLAGYPVFTPSRLTLHPHAHICEKHRREWVKAWADLSGSKELGEVEAQILNLKEPVPTRTEAIFALRALGFSRDDIARAMKGAGEGLSPEQILELVCEEAPPLEAVA